MNYFKKARSHVQGAMNDARELAQQIQQDYKQSQGSNDQPLTTTAGYYPPTPQQQQQPQYSYPSPSRQYENHGYEPKVATGTFNMVPMANCHTDDVDSTDHPLERGCPGSKFISVDLVQFYVFKPQFREKVEIIEDQFGICSSCYAALEPELASYFQPLSEPEGTHPDGPTRARQATFNCDMALPAVKALLHYECVPKRTMEPLLNFAKGTTEWFSCGNSSQQITQPVEYYTVKAIDDMAVCKWCFERNIRGTAFEREFTLCGPRTDWIWICDFGMGGYIYKAMLRELDGSGSQSPNISRFVENARRRMALPPCPGADNTFPPPGNGERVFTYEAVAGKSGVFCQACYWDRILGTSMEQLFNAYTELGDEFRGQIGCDMTAVGSQFAMDVAIKTGNDAAWRRCMEGRGKYPQCAGVLGVDEEDLQNQDQDLNRWYHLNDHPNIEICQWCYCTTVDLLGASGLFSPISRPLCPGVVRMCFLSVPEDLSADTSDRENFENTLVWRGTILRNWLHQGYEKNGDFTAFRQAASAIAARPPPCSAGKRAHKPASGRKWYGNNFYAEGDLHKTAIAVCEECYDYCIKGTSIEWFVGADLTDKTYAGCPNGFCCNCSTKRGRTELRQACQNGVFNEFADYLARRREVEARRKKVDELCNEQAKRQWAQKEAIDASTAAMQVNLMQQLNANTNATMMRIGGSVAEAAAPDYGQRFGNSNVGYGYLTHNGAAAAQASVDAAKLSQQSKYISTWQPSGNTWQDTQDLLALSKMIQAEWEAIQ
ncbi:hypothetical protein F5B22DRAFT_636797 [Xylaria bambusicola]|uniref:uncharacterized protein n=1 Tax=Xylaria bambusicola TaxID=326684 RepID=UPI002008BD48|nr:uncharacterized protein F5B22DRAFT_636797 [Xylaria bambusicola]KAI0514958.1 hypothetical protein F5B22DRAFT_636797 [Xylaria bambusicola]